MVLEYLEEVIHDLGLKIPIIELFDFVVGTSTGGIIALGLAQRGWTTEECRRKFVALAKKVFDPRPGMGIKGVRDVLKYAYNYIYRTEGVENAYKKAFGDDDILFGSPNPTRVKVAVTAVERRRGGLVTYLLTNYNRPLSSSMIVYSTLLTERSEQELKTWEAARATSAAPLMFKAFTHPYTAQILEDGALCYDNPISIADEERYALWGDHCHLDVHLSVGTGFLPESNDSPWHPPTYNTGMGMRAGTAKELVKDRVNAQKQYETFISSIRSSKTAGRYRRLDIDIDDGKGKTPIDKADDQEFERMVKLARNYCHQTATREEMKRIARCLVASCFFFGDERWDAAMESRGVWVCRGTIRSRLPLDRWEQLMGFLNRGLKFVVRMEDSREMREKEILVNSSQDSQTQGWFSKEICF
ncbi:acyl transferase/acyl hydrolase/lysophospholipase, partial [Trichophaea hybrida]